MSRLTDDHIYRELGQRIRLCREGLRLTQQQLADEVELTRTSITNIERGRQKIQIHTLYLIAAALDVEPCELLPSQQPDERVAFDESLLSGRDAEESAFVRQVLSRLRD